MGQSENDPGRFHPKIAGRAQRAAEGARPNWTEKIEAYRGSLALDRQNATQHLGKFDQLVARAGRVTSQHESHGPAGARLQPNHTVSDRRATPSIEHDVAHSDR
jgi:hypothetical protein